MSAEFRSKESAHDFLLRATAGDLEGFPQAVEQVAKYAIEMIPDLTERRQFLCAYGFHNIPNFDMGYLIAMLEDNSIFLGIARTALGVDRTVDILSDQQVQKLYLVVNTRRELAAKANILIASELTRPNANRERLLKKKLDTLLSSGKYGITSAFGIRRIAIDYLMDECNKDA